MSHMINNLMQEIQIIAILMAIISIPHGRSSFLLFQYDMFKSKHELQEHLGASCLTTNQYAHVSPGKSDDNKHQTQPGP